MTFGMPLRPYRRGKIGRHRPYSYHCTDAVRPPKRTVCKMDNACAFANRVPSLGHRVSRFKAITLSRRRFVHEGWRPIAGALFRAHRLNVSIVSCATVRYASARPLADPETAARKLVEIASGIDRVQDGSVFIELVNVLFLKMGGTGDQFRGAIALAKERGWPELHESGRMCG
ncbi:hypothetical protein ACTGJ9_012230 [Bradyrhizobium sp. RDM12]